MMSGDHRPTYRRWRILLDAGQKAGRAISLTSGDENNHGEYDNRPHSDLMCAPHAASVSNPNHLWLHMLHPCRRPTPTNAFPARKCLLMAASTFGGAFGRLRNADGVLDVGRPIQAQPPDAGR
jgi:hypothetical protein